MREAPGIPHGLLGETPLLVNGSMGVRLRLSVDVMVNDGNAVCIRDEVFSWSNAISTLGVNKA